MTVLRCRCGASAIPDEGSSGDLLIYCHGERRVVGVWSHDEARIVYDDEPQPEPEPPDEHPLLTWAREQGQFD